MKPINTLSKIKIFFFIIPVEVLIPAPFKTNDGIKALHQFTIFNELCFYNKTLICSFFGGGGVRRSSPVNLKTLL